MPFVQRMKYQGIITLTPSLETVLDALYHMDGRERTDLMVDGFYSSASDDLSKRPKPPALIIAGPSLEGFFYVLCDKLHKCYDLRSCQGVDGVTVITTFGEPTNIPIEGCARLGDAKIAVMTFYDTGEPDQGLPWHEV